MTTKKQRVSSEERYYLSPQWVLIWHKFKKHRLALAGGVILAILYFLAIFCEFISPYTPFDIKDYLHAPPTRIHWIQRHGFPIRPYVHSLKTEVDRKEFRRYFTEDKLTTYPLRFFVRGAEYRFWGLFRTNIHFIGVDSPGVLFLFGTDHLGRDMFTRTLYAARISLSIGFAGVGISFLLGCLLGGLSGFYGGRVDLVIQRAIEFLMSIPQIPIWMAISAALPKTWSPIMVYFGITIILSLVGWCGIGRVVRGKILELRETDYVVAARLAGGSDGYIIRRHLLPSLTSYLIVDLTLAIPNMILGETALSFLGIGLRPPVVSWGVLLKNAQNIRTVALHPWLLIPAAFVIVAVLGFNFLGDGLRDAADPYR